MKSDRILFLIISLCLCIHSLFSQNTPPDAWRPLIADGLAGASYKIPQNTHRQKWTFGLAKRVAPGQYPEQQLFNPAMMPEIQQALFQQPALWENLYRSLGGEFWFGTATQPGVFSNTHTTPERSFGLQFEVPLGRRWAAQIAAFKGEYSASSNFPVTVISQQHGQTKQQQGRVAVDIDGLHVQLSGRFYPMEPGLLRPFAGAGLTYSRYKVGEPRAELAGDAWSARSGGTRSQYSAMIPVGFSFQLRNLPVFAELSGGLQLPLESDAGWLVQFTVGGRW